MEDYSVSTIQEEKQTHFISAFLSQPINAAAGRGARGPATVSYTHLERSSVAMRYTNQPVSDIMEEAVKTLQPIADEKGVALIVLPTVIRLQCDRIKMTTALINLISKGIKYTPQGESVTVSVDVQDPVSYTQLDVYKRQGLR